MATETCPSSNSNSSPYTTPPIHLADEPYIMAILNSKVIDWYFRKTSTNNHVNIYELEQLPIPKANREQDNLITSLIDRIVIKKQNNHNSDISSLEKEIDTIVYQLYNLTPKEIAIIEQNN